MFHSKSVRKLRPLSVSVVLFWVVTPCGLVGRYQHFGGTLFPNSSADINI
jgi:hypothetical protein